MSIISYWYGFLYVRHHLFKTHELPILMYFLRKVQDMHLCYHGKEPRCYVLLCLWL